MGKIGLDPEDLVGDDAVIVDGEGEGASWGTGEWEGTADGS
jgi:hypothetical protein